MPMLDKSGHIPSGSYRVQLHAKFTFADLERLAPYFRELGISDLYLSPIFTAVPGSLHGYDVTDYSEVNPELGGIDGFRHLAGILRAGGGGILLDFVSNHMGIAGMLNQWWRDVLESGPLSRHAPFFDIQWKSDFGQDHPRVLVPLLQDHYGRALEQGEIKLVYENGFCLRYGETSLPVRPDSYPDILGSLGPKPGGAEDGAAIKTRIETLLTGSPDLRAALAASLERLNGRVGDARSFDDLHHIIENQHYRLARWQVGAHEINYRRFFAIDTLVGLHMENPEVFRECHALLGRLLAAGDVAGLRIDHIDGLRQPEDYLRRIQSIERLDPSQPLYVLVEKILARNEPIPETWPVHGTTGYEFIAQLAEVLVDGTQEAKFDEIYRRFTGETRDYPDMVCRSKRLIITEMFANAISNLGAELVEIVATDRLWRDLTRHELTTAVSELAAHLPVYRTYRRREEPVSDQDRAVLEQACSRAIAANPRADSQPFAFLRDLLIGIYPPAGASPNYRNRVLNWVLTFQQYTGAIMAKSVEDTGFYNYNRFIALNEVGCDPAAFGGSVENFHRVNGMRHARSPLALLTTSTHDSKLSEDVRARLYALSELAAEWEDWLAAWREKTARHIVVSDGRPAPDELDQYRFFQILIGAWPLSPNEVDDDFRSRLKDYMRKAVDESKRHTSILNKNEAYLAACDHFVDGVAGAGTAPDFLAAFLPCASRIARLGMVNSLTQLVLKCTVPGIPDFYQGNEIWDFSLVDPDNRRPVDYDRRRIVIESIAEVPMPTLLGNWRDGGIKLRVMRDLLRLRQALPNLFSCGAYSAVSASGTFGDRVVSFMRVHEAESLLVVVPRVAAQLGCPPVGFVWDDTRLGEAASAAGWKDVFSGRIFHGREPLFLRSLFADLPFAVLRSQKEKPAG
jgi:(1->4)-alpha-D-glucan 1-alpha-D-glucosylmutase